MRFAFQFPLRAMNHWDEWIGNHSLGDLAVAAERSGFDIVTSTDHPFPDARWLKSGGHHAFDPFVSLAFMAAVTTRIKVLTFLVVSGYRNPYVTAKAAASLDNLSGGRLLLGIGAGYQKDEFAVLGASFEDRGKRLDSALAAMRAAWTGEIVDFDDSYYPAHGHVQQPRPAQPGGPPVWFGGNSTAALRRVAEVGSGWMPIDQGEQMAAITGTPPLGIEQLPDRIATLQKRRAELGRDEPLSVTWAPRGGRDIDAHADLLAAGLDDYRAAGVTHVLLESRARSVDDCLRELELYRPIVESAR